MYVLDNVPLSAYSTMRLGGTAAHLAEIHDRFEIGPALSWAQERNLPVIMIGEGSNIVWRDEGFPGLILVNRILRFETFAVDEDTTYVTVGAGEPWDSVVERVVALGYSGIEELSLIPGTAGATPVQNVGAYGREIKDVLTTVEAFDREQGMLTTLAGADCEFSYRSSRFKTTDRGRFFISAITLRVSRAKSKPPLYDSIAKYFQQHNISEHTAQAIRDAVIAIRSSKLPDPKQVANNGSFFKNPVIDTEQLVQLEGAFPGIAHWKLDDGTVKVSAAWLVEQAGFKDVHDSETGIGTWATQPLVFINEHAHSTAQLLAFREKVKQAVLQKFAIELEQEPELLP